GRLDRAHEADRRQPQGDRRHPARHARHREAAGVPGGREVRPTMRVVVFGAGAVGGHLAARLAAHGPAAGIEVAAVARGARLEAMNQRGTTLWIGEARPAAPIHATDRPETLGHQDVVLVTMKSSVLPGVAHQLGPLIGPGTTVIFAMNGIPWWYLHRLKD